MSTKFTTDLPPDDAFGAEANFIVIHPERGEIWSPCSSRQINAERFGFAARGGYLWAKRDPDMARALAAPQTQGNEGLLAHIAKLEDEVTKRDTAMSAARKAAVAIQDATERLWGTLA